MALRQAEEHALGMREDALRSALAETVADLRLASSLTSTQDYLGTPGSSGQNVKQELEALLAVHPEYEEAAILLSDGQVGLYVVGRPTQAEEASGAALEEAGLAPLQHAQPWMKEDVFIAYGAENEAGHDHETGSQLDLPPLLVGTRVESADGTLIGAVVLRLAWQPLLTRYATGHPDSQSIPALKIDASPPLVLSDPSSHESAEMSVHETSAELSLATRGRMEGKSAQVLAAGGLLTFNTIALDANFIQPALGEGVPAASATPEVVWKAISWVPPRTLAGIRNAGLLGLVAWNVFGLVALGLIAWLTGDRLARRNLFHKRTSAEHQLFSAALDKYLPKVGKEGILADPQRYGNLGGAAAEVAVLFADVRGFTSFAEAQAPETVVSTLNRLLAVLLPSLEAHGGTLDKYTGDGFLAFFDSPLGASDASKRAVAAACEMQAAFSKLQDTLRDDAAASMGLGIGISWGRVVLGNVGTEEAMDFTVIGDTVNIAARLQALAASGEILVTSAVGEVLDEAMLTERRVTLELRGRQTPVTAYVITEASC